MLNASTPGTDHDRPAAPTRPVAPIPSTPSPLARGHLKRILTVVAAVAGVALFAYAIRRAGAHEILDGIKRVGWGLGPILALAGLRFVARAEAWRLCTPPDKRLPMGRAFVAFLAGDAMGNVTPL